MKSLPGNIGNVKMKGKKHKLLSCGCCVCQDFRDKNTEKFKDLEIKEIVRSSFPSDGEEQNDMAGIYQ